MSSVWLLAYFLFDNTFSSYAIFLSWMCFLIVWFIKGGCMMYVLHR